MAATAADTSTRRPGITLRGWWKPLAAAALLGVIAYLVVLLHLVALTLLSMHSDIADMRGQLHQTTFALARTNRELLQTNRKLVETNGKLSGTVSGVRIMGTDTRTMRTETQAMRTNTGRMTRQLRDMQRGIDAMLGDIHQMTHRIVHAKLLF